MASRRRTSDATAAASFQQALDGEYILSISYDPSLPEGIDEEDPLLQGDAVDGAGGELAGKPDKLLPPDPWSIYRLNDLAIQWKPHPWIHRIIVFSILPILLWLVCFLLVGGTALPGGQLFTLFVVAFGGIGLGYLMTLVKLPALLGMLVVGLMVRNIPYFGIAKMVNPAVSSPLRQLALVIILTKAGIGLDPKALSKLKNFVLALALIPSFAEALVVALGSNLILGFPWTWAFVLGFIIPAVSPAVIVPCLLSLKRKGYGQNAQISTVVVAVASIADIVAISLFGIAIGFAFAPSGIVASILQGPIEIIFGVAFGLIWGYLIGIILLRKTQRSREDKFLHVFFTFGGGIVSIFGFKYIGYPGAGPLGCLILAFVAGYLLRKKNMLKNDIEDDSLSWAFGLLWHAFQPLLFGLIGTEIDLLALDGQVVGFGTLILVIGIMGRFAITYYLLNFSDFAFKEKLFVAMAWIPKATVQAALAPVGLDAARSVIAAGGDPALEALGLQVLTVSVLAILLTAPVGASLITLLGPKLLVKRGCLSRADSGKRLRKRQEEEKQESSRLLTEDADKGRSEDRNNSSGSYGSVS